MASSRRSRSDESCIRLYVTNESDMLSGKGLMMASRMAASSGGSYFAASEASFCTAAYDSVRISGGRLGNVSSARYWLHS